MNGCVEGSKESLVREMLQPRRAFYEFFELLHVGPIDAAHLGRWIDERLNGSGVDASGIGPLIVRSVGPRTQDVMLTARSGPSSSVTTALEALSDRAILGRRDGPTRPSDLPEG